MVLKFPSVYLPFGYRHLDNKKHESEILLKIVSTATLTIANTGSDTLGTWLTRLVFYKQQLPWLDAEVNVEVP